MKFFFDHDVPDEFRFPLEALGHAVVRLRQVLPRDTTDADILVHTARARLVLITCYRNDFLRLAETMPHAGIILLFRRRTRLAERTALIRLIVRAGEAGLVGNLTFA